MGDQDRALLVAEIYRNPGDDTVRLAFADLLDERGEHDRAEFIRVQVHAARCPAGTKYCAACAGPSGRGARAILNAHPEWRSCPCRVCGGTGEKDYGNVGFDDCYACGGSGDLLRISRLTDRLAFEVVDRRAEFVRGFVGRVACRYRELFRPGWEGDAIGLVPAAWALELAAALPTVESLDAADALARRRPDGSCGWESALIPAPADRYGGVIDTPVPGGLIRYLAGGNRYAGGAEAAAALGTAAAAWVRDWAAENPSGHPPVPATARAR